MRSGGQLQWPRCLWLRSLLVRGLGFSSHVSAHSTAGTSQVDVEVAEPRSENSLLQTIFTYVETDPWASGLFSGIL